ncbi:MAG: hypothetical protein LUO93_01800 [Methanomicrobiales archaeon]|nr:hypothetical protein [Methanomicrobiales archaeon]
MTWFDDRARYRAAALRIGLTEADGEAHLEWSRRTNPDGARYHVVPAGDGLRIERELAATESCSTRSPGAPAAPAENR